MFVYAVNDIFVGSDDMAYIMHWLEILQEVLIRTISWYGDESDIPDRGWWYLRRH